MKTKKTMLVAVLPVLAFLTFLPRARAISPPPDGCDPNFTTSEGCDALASLNTGVGGGALALNNGSSNTAVGVAALLLNTSGAQNTALGTNSLVFNDTGSNNTASGYFSLMNNTSGGSNTATGW